MASLRDIRRKISTVKNINKITQAMKMVAAAKLRRAQEKVDRAKPYAEKMKELLGEVAPHVPAEIIRRQPLLQGREGSRLGLLVISSDRGLCGSYNNNIIRKAHEFLREKQAAGLDVDLVTIGRKCTGSLRTRGYPALESFPMIGVEAEFGEVQAITKAVVGLYTREHDPVAEVWIAYTEFINAVTQRTRIERFLPIETGSVVELGEADEPKVQAPGWLEKLQRKLAPERSTDDSYYEMEPDPEALLSELIPRYVDNQVFQYLLEATASEYGARMTAMSTASDNARDLIKTLTLEYNRARQEAITKEILDIVGGAEALAED